MLCAPWQDLLAARAKGQTRLKPLLLDQVRPWSMAGMSFLSFICAV
jgi:hypothetical protein